MDQKIEVFSQGTNDSKNLRCETLYIGNYEYVNISSFAVFSIKLWLEEDGDLNINDPLYIHLVQAHPILDGGGGKKAPRVNSAI